MATNTSFKVQCPSCEAMIPIRDSNLVGRKIDCPKCKYRFVVEDPNDDADVDGPARKPAAKGKPKAKAKGGNNFLILGSVLGGVALIVLGVVAYMLMAGDGGTTPAKSGGGPITSNSTTTPTNTVAVAPNPAANPGGAAVAPNPGPAGNPAQPGAAALSPGLQKEVGEISNLLPNDTHSVIAINMDRLRNSTLGQQAFESRIGFSPTAFKTGFGLGVEEIARFIRAEHFGDQGWTFNVLKTNRPVTLADFQGPLGLKRGPKSPIQQREYFAIAPNPLLDHLSAILQSELEARDPKAEGKKKAASSGPLTLCQLNPTTLVVATQDAMEDFLQSNAEPERKSKMVGDAAAPGAAAGGGSRPQPRGRGGRGGAAPADAPEDAGEGGGPQFADRNAYLTLEPPLKAMLDRLEGNGENMVMTMAQMVQTDPNVVNRVREATGVQVEVRGMRVLGVALHQLNVERCKGEIGLEMLREQSAKDFEDQLKKVLGPAGRLLGLYLGGLRIEVEGADNSGGGPGGGGLAARGPGRGPAAGGPANPDEPNNPDEPPAGPGGERSKSTMKLERKGRTLLLNLDLHLNERAYDRIYALSEGTVMRMKGMVDMASGEPRFYELADATLKYAKEAVDRKDGGSTKEKKAADTFPRATFPRDESVGRLSRTWPPNQRVSWMAGLLPYLGYQEVYNDIQFKDSWRAEQNMKQGSVLIPAFLNPRYPRPTWRAHPASVGVARDLGATHFVGIAGVGVDAADWPANDPGTAKKLGVFGYERRTTVKDISDGMANTAYMIQVPPTHQRPWIAGGGATVTGIPETRSVQPFVSTQANGKRGTYLLMCDGSVRFVKDDVSDEVFQAMCTIKGGETVDLNQAPKVDRPKGPSMKTADAEKTAQAPGGQ